MKNKKGFTLIELILVIILIGIITGFVGGILLQETSMFTSIQPRKEAKMDSSLFMERILKDLKYAYKNEYTSGSNVKFKLPYDSFKKYTSVNIFLSGNKLYIKTDNSPSSIITDSVVYFNITTIRANYANYTSRLKTRNLVNIKITKLKDNQTITTESSIFLRNER